MRIRPLAIVAATFIVTAVATPSFGMYHAGTGRFMQRDPLGTDGARPVVAGNYQDGMNTYQYLKSKPVGKLDALGLQSADANHAEQARCCTCLLMGEGEGEPSACKDAIAHVMRNRQQLSGGEGWPSFRNEPDSCRQASKSPGTFEGGKGNKRYDKCHENFFECPKGKDPYNDAEKRALEPV